MTWDRQTLVDAFLAEEDADVACRSALIAGASYRAPSDDLIDAASLVGIYERRARHIEDRGIPTIGFMRGVERLRAVTDGVRAGSVHSDDFNFVFFLEPREPVVLACMAVAASAANADWVWENAAD